MSSRRTPSTTSWATTGSRQRLIEDAALLAKGRLDAAPMGYLICGPVGTGKTYLAECFAGSVGIPCVKLRNFRSKYVGETEGNLEQILTVLRAMGPVVVVIDEADAALGNREGGGDSGTSSRVFSMIASQMGDTRYRGKLIWMLLTSRPDLLPIDLKRQGRAEVHLPLFSPRDEDEVEFMIKVMAQEEQGRASTRTPCPTGLAGRGLSGADIESIVLVGQAKRPDRRAARRSSRDDLEAALERVHPVGAGAGEREAGAGGRARVHVDVVPARRVAERAGQARRAGQAPGADGRDPADDRRMTDRTQSSATEACHHEHERKIMSKEHGRTHWLDETTDTPLIGEYAERLGLHGSHGRRQDRATTSSRRRRPGWSTLMKRVEPELNDKLHEKVTHLLCELSAYNIMHTIHDLVKEQPKTKFRG